MVCDTSRTRDKLPVWFLPHLLSRENSVNAVASRECVAQGHVEGAGSFIQKGPYGENLRTAYEVSSKAIPCGIGISFAPDATTL